MNDGIRALLLVPLYLAGVAFTIGMRLRMERFARAQRALRRRYGIAPETPIRAYDDTVRRAVDAFAARHLDARFATTSGSTGAPKRIAYTRARLRSIKRENLSAATRMLLARGAARPGLFIFSSLKEEGSLASPLTGGRPRPGWIEGLVVPSRYLSHPTIEPLVDRYGAAAVRFLLLVAANPGLIYGTNPSTLAVFFGEVHERWDATVRLVRDLVRAPGALDPAVHRVVARVADRGAARRLVAVAAAAGPLPIEALVPGLRVFCTWDGGYVRPFFEQVRRRLPRDRIAHVPMYAMSTETLMTLLVFDRRRRARFLPLAPGVLYEFLPEGAEDRPEALLPPEALEPGRAYAMVVSDGYGLRRYQTDDLFFCRGRLSGLPDLVFLRRRGLAYSFTGEKLTGEQVEQAFGALRAAIPALTADHLHLTLAPSFPAGASLPRYRLLLAHAGAPPAGLDFRAIAAELDAALARLNPEFEAKLRSGRLAPTEAALVPYDALAAALDPRTRDEADRTRRTWESQFKLAPLLTAVRNGAP